MKFRSFAWSTGAAVLALVLLAGCPVDPPASLFTVSGSIERPEGTGKTAYIKLVTQGADYTAPAQFSTSVLIVTDTENYSIPDVEAGTYTVYAFVDMDGSAAGDPDPLPDSGDWAYGAPAVTVTVNSDLSYQIPAGHSSWTVFGVYSLTGTLVRAGLPGDLDAYVKLVPSGETFHATALYADAVVIGTADEASYRIDGVPAGTYGFYAFIDRNGNADAGNPMPDSGDDISGSPDVTVTLAADASKHVEEADWSTFFTYAVSGTISNSDAADGAFAYVKLVPEGAAGDAEALYLDQSDAFSAGAAWYSMTGVAPGTYGFYVFIDADADAGVPIPTTMPEPGEWSYGGAVTVAGDTTGDVGLTADWRRYAMFKVTGTLTQADAANGDLAYVKLVAAMAESNAEAVSYGLSEAFSGGSASYTLWAANANYTLYAFIDADADIGTPSATTLPEVGEWSAGNKDTTTFIVNADTTRDLVDPGEWSRYRLGTVLGTLWHTSSGVGTFAYVKLVASGDGPGGTALYSTSCEFDDTEHTADFLMPDVEFGAYRLYAFIDLDANAAGSGYMPTNGDLMPTAYVYEIDLGTPELRQDCYDWTAVYNMSGMLYKEFLSEDEIAYIKLVELGASYQATALYSTSTTIVLAGSGNYAFALLPEGSYSVHFFIDVNGNAESTDYLPDSSDQWASKNFTLGADSTTLDVLDAEWEIFLVPEP